MQQLLLQLEEGVKLHQAEHAAQKARREVEEKAREKAKRQRIAEEKKKKKRILEYFQQLWNKVLAKEAALLESAEGFQVTGSKCKEAPPGDDVDCQSSKKIKGKQPVRY